MTNRNIEDIDKLFREGLNPEGNPVPFQEADWLNLQQRLARHQKRKRGIFWISRVGAVAALLLLFFALRQYMPQSHQNVRQAEVQHKETEIKKENNPANISPETKEIAGTTDSLSNKSLALNKQQGKKPPVKSRIAPVVRKENGNSDSVKVNNLSDQELITTTENHTAENNPTQKENLPPAANNPVEQPVVQAPEPKQATEEAPVYAAIREPNERVKPERTARKLALSLLTASDYNGVNNLNNASMGNDFGLMVSVTIARNWNFSTGGIYAKKVYQSGFGSYSPSKNIWSEYYPTAVNADCRVLDIPLNINYTLLRLKNTTIAIGSGISSYIMLREDYRFTYPENEVSSPSTYRIVNENQHWMSVVNFQASFNQRLSSRLSVGLQPFMKIPLKDIGFAGVKLQSLGMALNLGYNFNL